MNTARASTSIKVGVAITFCRRVIFRLCTTNTRSRVIVHLVRIHTRTHTHARSANRPSPGLYHRCGFDLADWRATWRRLAFCVCVRAFVCVACTLPPFSFLLQRCIIVYRFVCVCVCVCGAHAPVPSRGRLATVERLLLRVWVCAVCRVCGAACAFWRKRLRNAARWLSCARYCHGALLPSSSLRTARVLPLPACLLAFASPLALPACLLCLRHVMSTARSRVDRSSQQARQGKARLQGWMGKMEEEEEAGRQRWEIR